MKLFSKILKIVCAALAITVFGLMFYSPMLEGKNVQAMALNYAQVFFKGDLIESTFIRVCYEPAIGGFIGFLFVLFGGLITLASAQKIKRKNKTVLVIVNFVGIVFSLVGCLLIFLIPTMFTGANPEMIVTYKLSTVMLITGFIGVLEAILASVAAVVDINTKI